MFAQAPNGKSGPTYIITGSENGEVVFYDLQSRNIAFTLPGNKGAFPLGWGARFGRSRVNGQILKVFLCLYV